MGSTLGAAALRLTNYKTNADCMATLLFPHAEVILHSLATQTVIHIANNISKCKIGSALP